MTLLTKRHYYQSLSSPEQKLERLKKNQQIEPPDDIASEAKLAMSHPIGFSKNKLIEHIHKWFAVKPFLSQPEDNPDQTGLRLH